MLYFFIGQNFLIVEEKIKEFSNKFKRISYNNNFFSELQKYLAGNLLENFDLVLNELDKLKENEAKKLVFILKENSSKKKIFLIFKKNPEFLLKIFDKEKLVYKYFDLDEERKSYNFIDNLIKKYAGFLPENIIDFIKENYKDYPDFLIQDLKKIKALESKNINEIKNLLSLHVSIFKIQEAFLEKKWPVFIHYFKKFILEDKSRGRAESLKVLSLLANSLIKILLLKKGVGVEGHYFYLRKLKEYSQKFSENDLKQLLLILSKTDRKFKKFTLNLKDLPEDIYLSYLFLKQR